jgi:hypothetical protein
MKKINAPRKLIFAVFCGVSIISTLLFGCSRNSDTQTAESNTELTTSKTTPSTSTTVVQASPGEVTMSISVSQQQIAPGDNFTVNVIESTTIPSRGAQCALSFDPSAVTCDSSTVGDFYSTWANDNSCQTVDFPTQPTIDNTAGTVSTVGVAIIGEDVGMQKNGIPGGVTGQGVFYSFDMTANAGVSKTINFILSNVEIDTADAQEIQGVTSSNATVTIGP